MLFRETITRRTVLKTLGAGAALLAAGRGPATVRAAGQTKNPPGPGAPFELPKLPYAYDALEPHIDARTMEIHHTKHHQAYVSNANQALADLPALQQRAAEELLADLNRVPEAVRATVRNNVGGHVNHSFFWPLLAPGAGGEPAGELKRAIEGAFGSVDACRTRFTDAAMRRFGSGWAWLVWKDGALAVTSTANQDSPISDGARPVLGVDVWEHAYYLKYQNRRADYLAAFWQIANWSQAAENLATARRAG